MQGREAVLKIGAGVVLAYLAAIGAELYLGKEIRRGSFNRLLSDDYDKSIYYRRGLVLAAGRVPYRDSFSEYPPLATLSFATPFLISRACLRSYPVYSFLWSSLMGVFFLATLRVVAECRVRLGLSPWPALILLSPSVLYFALMRFDVLAAFVLCLSLDCFLRGRWSVAHALLAVGAFTKWFPALAFPVYLSRHWTLASGGRGLRAWRPAAAFLLTVGLLAAASIHSFTWDGFFLPYRFQTQRAGQYFNLYWLLERWFTWAGWIGSPAWTWVAAIFLALQLSIFQVVAIKSVASDRDVVRYSVLGIFLFMLFARIDSPQWLLWYLPAALMVARGRLVLGLALAVTLLNYLAFPLAYDLSKDFNSPLYIAVVSLRGVVSLGMILLLLRERDPA